MAELGIPFDMPELPDDVEYYTFSAAEERLRIGAQMTDGVFPKFKQIDFEDEEVEPINILGDALEVSAGTGLTVKLAKGMALCGATFYMNTEIKPLSVQEGISDIIIELDLTKGKIKAKVQPRNDGKDLKDSLVRNDALWQICVATVTVPSGTAEIASNMIIDQRLNTESVSTDDHNPICGMVASNGIIGAAMNSAIKAFNAEWEYIKGQLSDDAAGNLQNQIGILNELKTPDKSNLVRAINYIKAAAVFPIGSILPYASNIIPDSWLLCDGRAVSRTTYSALYSAIGTTYGTGNGSTTFNLPDMRNRTVTGRFYNSFSVYENYTSGSKTIKLTTTPDLYYLTAGGTITYGGVTRTISSVSGSLTSAYYTITLSSAFSSDILAGKTVTATGKIGQTGGSKMHTLSVDEIPAHSHTYNSTPSNWASNGSGNGVDVDNNYTWSTATTGSTGGGIAHNNMPPFITMNYIIYAGV